MIRCQNCGKENSPESQFCRFCGNRFAAHAPQQDLGYPSPRPYSWKTDEYQTQAEARPQVEMPRAGQGLNDFAAYNYAGQTLAYRPGQFMTGSYRCPNCMSQQLPRTERRISTAGWITFAVLLVFFFPLFWIGLLIKENVFTCPSCNTRIQ